MKIHNKLFFILFSFSLLLVTVLLLLIQWSIGKGMIEYVNSKESEALKPVVIELELEYKKNNNWSTMHNSPQEFGDLLFSKLKDSDFMMGSRLPRKPRNSLFEFNQGKQHQQEIPENHFTKEKERGHSRFRKQKNYALFNSNGEFLVGGRFKNAEYKKEDIIVDGIKVGWLGVIERKKIIDGYELEFIQQQQSYLWLIALVTMFLVALITLLLARHLAEPIKLIMLGMHKLTQGDYNQKINLKRKDELGELSRDFNELAITLDENDSARRRWLANISHELRTPIAILRGELEAMLDNVRPLNKENIGSANDEVKHLQHLVNDLQQLTSADVGGMHYRKKENDLTQWLSKEVDKYTSYLAAANVSLVVEMSVDQAYIFSDSTRICQLFENLLNNCIKYAEATTVKISLLLDENGREKRVRIVVEDNGVGVPDVHLPHLFEHLYRVDNSRNRKTGGSGLGLSICAHIVSAHQGSIMAAHSELGGLAIIIEFPLSK